MGREGRRLARQETQKEERRHGRVGASSLASRRTQQVCDHPQVVGRQVTGVA